MFEWRTRYACRHCLAYEVTNVIGQCTWNKREITQTPSPTCQIYSQLYLDEMATNQGNISASVEFDQLEVTVE